MDTKINIKTGKICFEAELNDSPTAKAIIEALPIKETCNRWGGEIYFSIPVSMKLETNNSRDILQPGEIGYWPTGNAFCIFFGQTPASNGCEIRAASAVNIVGKITGNLDILEDVPDGSEVMIDKF